MDWNGSPSLVLIQACDERPVFLMRGPAVETYRAVPLAFSVGPVVIMVFVRFRNSVMKDGLGRLEGGHDARSRQWTEILCASRMFLPC